MFFKKGSVAHRYFQKGVDGLGYGVKTVAQVLDSPITNAILDYAKPELGVGLHGLRSSGVLEKLKH